MDFELRGSEREDAKRHFQFVPSLIGVWQGRIRGGTPPSVAPPQSDSSPPFMLYGYTNYKFSVLPSSLQQQAGLLPGFQPADVV